MQNEQEIVPVDESTGLIPTTDVQQRVQTMLANRQYIVDNVKPLLIEGVDIYILPGMKKPSLGKPGAEKLAAIFGLIAKFEVDTETMAAIGSNAGGKQYIAYICNLSAKGRVAGQGRGATFIEWHRNSYRMVFLEEFNRLKTTLKEEDWKGPFEGTSKSSGKPYQYWKVREEPVFDQLALNKAIKMSQKSAFVDAVIRTTGMSDLFTQDLEDIQNEDTPLPPEEVPPKAQQHQPANEHKQVVNQDGTVDDPFQEAAIKCELCGSDMKVRNSARGQFLGCSNYPNCKNTRNV